jgi:uncharacterized protein (TIRG00374 family)
MKQTSKRVLSVATRASVAAIGLGYVAMTQPWTDHIYLPAGFERDGEIVTEEAQEFPIVAQSEMTVTIQLDDRRKLPLERKDIKEAGDGPLFYPGLRRTLASADWLWLLAALALMGAMPVLQSLRWQLLMRCRGLPAPTLATFRIYMVGMFFNSFMPGTTGGDVMKAYYAARGGSQKAATVISVVVDRVIGLVGLLLVGMIAGAAMFHDPNCREPAIAIWLLAAVLAGGAAVYFSNTLRRFFGINRVVSRLPEDGLLRRIDEAVVAYRHHRGALLGALALALPVQVVLVLCGAFSGWALGMPTTMVMFKTLLVILPLVLLAGAVPISFMGFGVIEPVGRALLVGAELRVTPNQIVTMLVLIRLYAIVYSLLGAVFLTRGNLTLHRDD